jgi:S1-C subfamily serine protease
MDLEELNKSQIILLVLLVSFVTSIATGIVTVTLVAQAPPAVTQTINRVVERTVERVVPADSGDTNEVIREKVVTVVVKEDDLITESIDKNKQHLVRIVRVVTTPNLDAENEGESEIVEEVFSFIGLGLIVTSNGIVATDRANGLTAPDVRALVNKKLYPVSTIHTSSDFETALLQIETLEGEGEVSFKPATLIGEKSLKLGQTVIALGGEERTNVAMGIIGGLEQKSVTIENAETGEIRVVTVLDSITTNISNSSINGSPLLNIFGEVIGIKTSANTRKEEFTPSDVIEQHLRSLEESASSSAEEETAEGDQQSQEEEV